MQTALLLVFAGLCFVAPPMFRRKGHVSGLTVVFWMYFGLTALIYGEIHHVLYKNSFGHGWSQWIGPALVQVPFGVMIYLLERPSRAALYAFFVAFLGSFLVTGLWLLTSIFFLA